jgi:methionyl aminopeptidase
MINVGTWEVEVLEDDWTAVTKDGSLSAQFEHTVLVTSDGVEILTAREGMLTNSELFPNYWG